jgi:hypothetical protein
MSHQKIRPIDPGIGQNINGDQFQDVTEKSDQSTQAFKRSTETKSKMAAVAAILDERRS